MLSYRNISCPPEYREDTITLVEDAVRVSSWTSTDPTITISTLMEHKNFVLRLDAAIVASGKSEAEITRLAKVDKGIISSMKISKAKGPGVFSLAKIAQVIDVSIDWLVGNSPTKCVPMPGDILMDVALTKQMLKANRTRDVPDDPIFTILPDRFEIRRPSCRDFLDEKRRLDDASDRLKLPRMEIDQ